MGRAGHQHGWELAEHGELGMGRRGQGGGHRELGIECRGWKMAWRAGHTVGWDEIVPITVPPAAVALPVPAGHCLPHPLAG